MGEKEDNTSLFEKLSIKNHKAQKINDSVMMPPQTMTRYLRFQLKFQLLQRLIIRSLRKNFNNK